MSGSYVSWVLESVDTHLVIEGLPDHLAGATWALRHWQAICWALLRGSLGVFFVGGGSQWCENSCFKKGSVFTSSFLIRLAKHQIRRYILIWHWQPQIRRYILIWHWQPQIRNHILIWHWQPQIRWYNLIWHWQPRTRRYVLIWHWQPQTKVQSYLALAVGNKKVSYLTLAATNNKVQSYLALAITNKKCISSWKMCTPKKYRIVSLVQINFYVTELQNS